MKRFLIIFIALILGFSFLSAGITLAYSQESGTFYGFEYEYGEETRNFTKAVSYSHAFSESEDSTKSREFTILAPLRTGLETVDVFWERWTNRSKAAPSSEWELPGSPQNWAGYRPDGFLTNGTGAGGAWYRYNGIELLNWIPFTQKFNFSWFGRQLDIGLAENVLFHTWHTSYVTLESVGTSTVPMQDWLGIVHNSMTVNTYHIKYYDDSGTPGDQGDDEVVFEEILTPQFVLVKVLTTLHQVQVSETSSVAADLSGQFNFSGTWTENLFGQHVSVKDGVNYWFDYFALISGSVVYDYSGGFTLEGSLSTNVTRDVTFVSNGSAVPESIRPVHLQSLKIVLKGAWDHYEEEDGVLYGEGAIQSLIQVLLTKASTTESPNLAVWGNFNPGRIIGYKDVNGDDILTAYLNESFIATPDAIMAIGFPEGAHLTGNYYANGIANARVYTSLGDWIIADDEAVVTKTVDKTISSIWGYD
ncbi:MAG: hypothetical protein ACXAC2_12075, partial [Candidatus Kariarchaeaceae archaeon]